MSNSNKVVERYQTVLKELGVTGPDERWRSLRLATDVMLRTFEAQLQYQKQGGNSGLTDKDRANIKEAIELRRQIYRKVKALKETA